MSELLAALAALTLIVNTVLLLSAGFSKLVNPAAAGLTIVEFRVARRPAHAQLYGLAAGVLELSVGLCCLMALFSVVPIRPVALICAALYGFFVAILYAAVRRRSSFSCNCFGASYRSPVSRIHIVRAAVLSAMSLIVAIVSVRIDELQLGYAIALFVPIAAIAVLATQLRALVPRGSLEGHNIRGGE